MRLLETLTPLGGEPIPAGTVVEAKRAMDRCPVVVDRPGWLPMNPWEYEIVQEEAAAEDG